MQADLELFVQEDDSAVNFSVSDRQFKVTDSGYDKMACIVTDLPVNVDFSCEAEVEVRRFLELQGSSGQEAFGIFLRSTLEKDVGTGMYYGNMAAIGGYYGRYNFFGRGGITRADIGNVLNFTRFERVNRPGGVWKNDPLHYRIVPEQAKTFHFRLNRIGSRISAEMTDEQGVDVLSPEINGGMAEVSPGKVSPDENGAYAIEKPDLFSDRRRKLFLGFMAAGGVEMAVKKDSFRLTILGRRMAPFFRKAPVPYPEDPFAEPIPGRDQVPDAGVLIRYTSPEGTPDGDGTPESPLDLLTAVRCCREGERVFLLPGHYRLSQDILLDGGQTGLPAARTQLCCGTGPGQAAVLDFGETDHALRIRGNWWNVGGIRVTGGLGIIIEGSYNRVCGCHAFRNLETGILIRHPDNDSPRVCWPSYNLVENCVSYENRDSAECNADGFACKVAAGQGNVFRRCVSWLNADDGFDLFAKNRAVGAVQLEECESYLNGYKRDGNGKLTETAGNGSGFKLGGSGMYVEHRAVNCVAEGNKRHGFTCNSNPYMELVRCIARNNGGTGIAYYRNEGTRGPASQICRYCDVSDQPDFEPQELLQRLCGEHGVY